MRSERKKAWDRARILTQKQKERKRECARISMRKLREFRNAGKPKKDRFPLEKIWGRYMVAYRSEILVLGRDLWAKHPVAVRHFAMKAYYGAHEANKLRLKLKAREDYLRTKENPDKWSKRLEKNRRWRKEWEDKNPEKAKKSRIEWRKSDSAKQFFRDYRRRPENRIIHNVRNRVHRAISGHCSKSATGLSRMELVAYIQSKFRKGMTWENYGKKWEIDHIIPVAAFNLSNPLQVQICNHYSNLRPLWKKQNQKKSDKWYGTLPLLTGV